MASIAVAYPSNAFSEKVTSDYFYQPMQPVLSMDSTAITPSKDVIGRVVQCERRLGDSELSYYLPSRASGVNDMYLHLGFHAPEHLVQRKRMQTVWAILRLRHPLLASKVVMRDYDDVSFVYNAPQSVNAALFSAGQQLELKSATKDELIDAYLNGPRTLSNDRLSYLILARNPSTQASLTQYELLICAAHFLGDGMALHQFATDFFSLLGSSKSDNELEINLHEEFKTRVVGSVDKSSMLPNTMEDNLPVEGGRLHQAVAKVDFKRDQANQIGVHAFPRRCASTRHTIVPTVSFDEQRTKSILRNCKAHGVSVSAALFAVCNIAWARMATEKRELPMMMYSALNMRPYFMAKPLNDSYWFLAVGYFNVILSSFLPKSIPASSTFWHRARLSKEQSTRAVKSPMVVSRSRVMARERGERSRKWAKEDDEKEKGIWRSPPSVAPIPTPKSNQPPSTALIGLSLLGNLDGIYKHANFPEIKLHTLTTGSRQRAGGMLLFGYTFAGKLWVSLGYDENGFDKEVVTKFWGNCLGAVDEFM